MATAAPREMPIFTRTFDLLTWLLPATLGLRKAILNRPVVGVDGVRHGF